MSEDLRTAAQLFMQGFDMGDRIQARWAAQRDAAAKWRQQLEWRKQDLAERRHRNDLYGQSIAQHGELMKAQAAWYQRRGAGGGGGAGASGGLSAGGQKFLENMQQHGLNVPAPVQQQSLTVNMPEQPPPPVPMPMPPPDDGSSSGSSDDGFQHGGMVPEKTGGTSGPGSGFGVRASPPPGYVPGMQDGGPVSLRKPGQSSPYPGYTSLYPWRTPLPPIPSTTRAARAMSKPASAVPKSDEGMDPYQLPRGPQRLREFDLTLKDPRGGGADFDPLAPYPQFTAGSKTGGGGGGKGAIDTGFATDKGKKLGDQTRLAAYDPVSDAMDPRNVEAVNRWGQTNLWAQQRPGAPPPQAFLPGSPAPDTGTGQVFDQRNMARGGRVSYREGGRVQRFQDGGTPDPRYVQPMTEEEQRIRAEDPYAGPQDLPYARGGERPRPYPPLYRNPSVPAEHARDDRRAPPLRRTSNAGTERMADEDIYPGSLRLVPPPFAGEEARADERGVPPQGGAKTSGGERSRALEVHDAFDPTRQQLDPRTGLQIDASGRVTPIAPQGAPGAQPPGTAPTGVSGPSGAVTTTPPVTEPLGGYGLNPQGSNVYGAGLSSNNAAHDMTAITKAASDFAAHQFHLMEPETHSAAGYHALMSGAGAGNPAYIHQIFQQLDPNGTMPMNVKIEKAQQAVYDFWVSQRQPEKAAKVAFEVAQWANQQAKEHGGKAMEMIKNGDQNGALHELLAGYNWLPDGHTANYDPRSNTVVMHDIHGRESARIPVQPGTIQNLAMGMASGELGWDIMRGRGNATLPPGQPGQAAPSPPSGGPAAPTSSSAPAASAAPASQQAGPAGPAPSSQPAAAPPTQAAPQQGAVNLLPPVSQPPRQPAQPAQTLPVSGQAVPPSPAVAATAGPSGREPSDPNEAYRQAASTRDPQQRRAAIEKWYEDYPNAMPPQEQRRFAQDMPTRPNFAELKARADAEHEHTAQYIRGNISLLPGKGSERALLVNNANKANDDRYNKRVQDLRDAENEYNRQSSANAASEQRGLKSRDETQRRDFEEKADTYLTKTRKGYYGMNEDPDRYDKMAKQLRDKEAAAKKDGVEPDYSEDEQRWLKTHNSPLRYMPTKDQQEKLKDLGRKIWEHNPDMTPVEAMDAALAFTSRVDKNTRGVNNQTGRDARNYRLVGPGVGSIVVQNAAHEDIYIPRNTFKQIENMRGANVIDLLKEEGTRKQQTAMDKARGGLGPRAMKEIGKLSPVPPEGLQAGVTGM